MDDGRLARHTDYAAVILPTTVVMISICRAKTLKLLPDKFFSLQIFLTCRAKDCKNTRAIALKFYLIAHFASGVISAVNKLYYGDNLGIPRKFFRKETIDLL